MHLLDFFDNCLSSNNRRIPSISTLAPPAATSASDDRSPCTQRVTTATVSAALELTLLHAPRPRGSRNWNKWNFGVRRGCAAENSRGNRKARPPNEAERETRGGRELAGDTNPGPSQRTPIERTQRACYAGSMYVLHVLWPAIRAIKSYNLQKFPENYDRVVQECENREE